MPKAKPNPTADLPVILVAGDDDFCVKRRARQLYNQWCAATAGLDNEIIDAEARSQAEAIKATAKLRESLQTLPFFSGAKVVWFRDCTFLAPEPRNRSSPLLPPDALSDLIAFLESFKWTSTRLIISGSPVSSDSPLLATVKKIGRVEILNGLSSADKDWPDQAEEFVRAELKVCNQEIDDDALGALVAAVGPNLRQLAIETEKVSLHAGANRKITLADVTAVVSRRRQVQAFGLAEAVGDRDLSAALRHLTDELAQTRSQSDRPGIGLVHMLLAKLRNILLMKELHRMGYLKPTNTYQKFKLSLQQVPPELFTDDPKTNPLKAHPFTLFRAALQCPNYTVEELVSGMEILLDANRKLVMSQLDDSVILQKALVDIIGSPRSCQSSSKPLAAQGLR